MSAKMTERQQLAIALRESMSNAPTPVSSVVAAAPSPASQQKESLTPPADEVSFFKQPFSHLLYSPPPVKSI